LQQVSLSNNNQPEDASGSTHQEALVSQLKTKLDNNTVETIIQKPGINRK